MSWKKWIKPASGLVLALPLAAAAQLNIDWFTIEGGGGTSTGGGYSLSGGISQAGAGQMSGDGFTMDGGFWSLIAVQTPDAPLLSIEWQGADLRVFWPLSGAGFVLDQSLTATGAWSQVSFPYTTNATGISISAPAPTGNNFYRLRKL